MAIIQDIGMKKVRWLPAAEVEEEDDTQLYTLG